MFDLTSYGKTVSFEVYPTSILGTDFKAVKVLSIVDYETARLYSDINNLAVSVYPLLPIGTPKDFKQYNYLKIKYSNGDIRCISLNWINSDSIVVHSNVVANIRINLDNIDTLDIVRRLLIANNITPLEITIE